MIRRARTSCLGAPFRFSCIVTFFLKLTNFRVSKSGRWYQMLAIEANQLLLGYKYATLTQPPEILIISELHVFY